MTRLPRKLMHVLSATLLCGAVALAGQEPNKQMQNEQGTHVVNKIVRTVEQHDLSLAEAIRMASEKAGGPALAARHTLVPRHAWGKGDMNKSATERSRLAYEVLCAGKDNTLKVVTVDAKARRVKNVRETAMVGRSKDRAGRTQEWAEAGMRFSIFRLFRADQLLGTTVRNIAGQELGEINDLAINRKTGEVLYAALERDGVYADRFAVPLGALEVVNEGTVLLDITAQEFDNVEGFSEDNWPTAANPRWGASTDQYDNLYSADTGYIERAKRGKRDRLPETRVVRATELMDREVRDGQGNEFGTVAALTVDPDRALLAYAVVSYGGTLGMGEEHVAVPWEAVRVGDNMPMTVDMSSSRLKNAPRVNTDNWGNAFRAPWVKNVYQFFDVQPYWLAGGRGQDM